jgi:hypothetical protein
VGGSGEVLAKRFWDDPEVRIVLSDGSGLTSRQCATLLDRMGHEVHALVPGGLTLTRMTRHIARVHTVPPYGPDPLAWWAAAREVLERTGADVLLPTQEQVAVISRYASDLDAVGVRTVVPAFDALVRVQDKVSAHATLQAVGLRRPPSWVARDRADLVERVTGPVFVKAPIGTASTAVRRVAGREAVAEAARAFDAAGAFADGGVLVEEPVSGPLVMVQSVFAGGQLIALHANERTREGAGGGACNKTSRHVPGITEDVQTLGTRLRWHGALSLDAILTPAGPVWIDVNPRLVEPGNAARAGTDLLEPMLALARGDQPPGPAGVVPDGVRTHQLLLSVLGAAQDGRGRRGVLRELWDAALSRGPYRESTEELTPLVGGDVVAGLPVAIAAAATLLNPASHRWFTRGAVSGYALTPSGWRQIAGPPAV